MALSAEQILGADDLPAEDVDVPEWGGIVRVRGLTGAERDKFEASFMSGDKMDSAAGLAMYRARLAAACIVDDEGKKMFRSDAEVKRLGAKSARALSRVVDVASRLSGLTESDAEELTGN